MPRPRGGDWLEAEVRAWQEAGIDAVVSLLVPSEEWELGLQREAEVSQAAGIRFFAFPIPDRQTPRSAEKMSDLTGQSVGRSALLAAALLIEAGISPDEAFDRVEAARGCPVPDTPEQRRWVAQLARERIEWAALTQPSH